MSNIIKFPLINKDVKDDEEYDLYYPVDGTAVWACRCGVYHFYHTSFGVFCAGCNGWQDVGIHNK